MLVDRLHYQHWRSQLLKIYFRKREQHLHKVRRSFSERKKIIATENYFCLLGIYFAVGGIGIGLGFLATSQFLKVYTYIKKPVWLTPHYSEWVGAWWMVYAIGTCFSLIIFILLYFIDNYRYRRLRSLQQARSSVVNPIYGLVVPAKTDEPVPLSSVDSSISGLEPPVLIHIDENSLLKFNKNIPFEMIILIKDLFLNLRYMGVTSCAVIEALLIKGYLAFLSKHIEYQFRTTSSHSSIYMGIISLFSVILGAPLGAYFVKRFNMNGRQCAKFCCIILSISSVFFLGLMLHCREPTIGLSTICANDTSDDKNVVCLGTSHAMPVILTAFDADFFEENLIESDRIESPCKRKCRKNNSISLRR